MTRMDPITVSVAPLRTTGESIFFKSSTMQPLELMVVYKSHKLSPMPMSSWFCTCKDQSYRVLFTTATVSCISFCFNMNANCLRYKALFNVCMVMKYENKYVNIKYYNLYYIIIQAACLGDIRMY